MIKILLIPPLLIDKKGLNEIKIKAKYLSKLKNIYQRVTGDARCLAQLLSISL